MGILLALVGVAVLAVAIIALHHPKSTSSNAGSGSTATSGVPTAPSTSAPPTSAAPDSSSRTPSSGATTAPPASLGASTDASSGPADSASGIAAAKAIPLVVLNNTTISGLAAQAQARFESGGWTVSSRGNLTNNIISTCAYYDPSVTGAKNAATVLQAQYPTIKRVEPKFDGLPSGPVVVVLTPDYSAG